MKDVYTGFRMKTSAFGIGIPIAIPGEMGTELLELINGDGCDLLCCTNRGKAGKTLLLIKNRKSDLGESQNLFSQKRVIRYYLHFKIQLVFSKIQGFFFVELLFNLTQCF